MQRVLIRLEAAFHWTACLLQAMLLFYVVLRNPMAPVLPLASPMFLWSVGLSFVLLANLTAYLRGRAASQAFAQGAPMGLTVALALLWWGVSLWLASGMTWVVYFWTASIVLHAMLAPLSVCAGRVELPQARRFLPLLEAFFVISLLLLVQVRGIYVNTYMGRLEAKYLLYLEPFCRAGFFAGAGLFLIAARFRLTVFTHGAMAALALFTAKESAWPLPLLIGYGFPALFQATRRQGGFAYALSCVLVAFTWILGSAGFALSGLIVYFHQALDVAQALNRYFLAGFMFFFALWIVGTVLVWRKRDRKAMAPMHRSETVPGGWVCVLSFCVILGVVLAPGAALLAATAWPPTILKVPASRPVGAVMSLCHAGYSESEEEYRILDELGVQSMRVDFRWGEFQPEPGKWRLDAKDNYVAAAAKHGKHVIGILNSDNGAVEQDPVGKNRANYIAPSDVPRFLEFVRQVVAHYQGRVEAWEIWNEPDIERFWDGPLEEFYALARQTADAIRSADASACIVGTACTGPMGALMPAGIDGLHATGALAQVQHPSGHLYATDPRHYYLEFMKLIGAARRFNHSGSPWITELGAPDGGYYPWGCDADSLAEYVIKAYTVATSMGIDRVVWYCFHDGNLGEQARQPIDAECFFGLIGPGDSWKPSAYAYRLFSRYCSNSMLRNDLVQVSGGLAARQLRTAFYRRENGPSALVLWFEPMLRPWGRARVHVDFGGTNEPPVIHDIGSAYEKALLDDHIELTEKPVVVTFGAGGDTEKIVRIEAAASPVDALWLAFVAGALLVSLAVGLRERSGYGK